MKKGEQDAESKGNDEETDEITRLDKQQQHEILSALSTRQMLYRLRLIKCMSSIPDSLPVPSWFPALLKLYALCIPSAPVASLKIWISADSCLSLLIPWIPDHHRTRNILCSDLVPSPRQPVTVFFHRAQGERSGVGANCC